MKNTKIKKNLFLCIFFICSFCVFSLPAGYGTVKLGMSVEEVKTELKKNSDFGYRGDRDVSLLPSTKETIIETDASKNPYSFFSRCWFQFIDGKLFSITLNLNKEKLDYFGIYSSLAKKYGTPAEINPSLAKWSDSKTIMSLEKPLTLKYIDAQKLKALEEKSGVQKTYEEKTVEDFLDSL